MRSPPTALREGHYVRRSTRSEGLFFDDFAPESAWVREEARVFMPRLPELKRLVITGEIQIHPDVRGIEQGIPELDIYLNGAHVATVSVQTAQSWEVPLDVPHEIAAGGAELRFVLRGVGRTNLLAWLGRVGANWPGGEQLQRFRKQNRNRQLRIRQISADDEVVFDFANRHAPYSPVFARAHTALGINVVGFLTADLGIGESARCMLRAADAVKIPAAAVLLKLHCKARMGDSTFAAFVQDHNPHPVNVFHLDAPASRDIDTHHGPEFRSGKYNVGYWAWELPEFPDAWLPYFDFFNEIWCPSDFVRHALAEKSPVPVITMPHAVEFQRPARALRELRQEFGLPADKYLFLFLYDLNSYTERKNPTAVIEAFRRSGLADRGAALVIKVHGLLGNEKDFESLRNAVSNLPGTTLISDALTRPKVYELEAACDCFVSLHRSEGFGFAVAECMYLGKPVIATNWSATSEFLNEENGAPVDYQLVTLKTNHGPYSKGQRWAEPNVDAAAQWMQRLFADRALGEKLGAAAQRTIEARFSLRSIGSRYRRRLEAIASW